MQQAEVQQDIFPPVHLHARKVLTSLLALWLRKAQEKCRKKAVGSSTSIMAKGFSPCPHLTYDSQLHGVAGIGPDDRLCDAVVIAGVSTCIGPSDILQGEFSHTGIPPGDNFHLELSAMVENKVHPWKRSPATNCPVLPCRDVCTRTRSNGRLGEPV